MKLASILTAPIRLIDGPLIYTRRNETVARMAQALVAEDAFHSEQDAIRLLMHKGFPPVQVFNLIDDARQLAMQHVVARERSRDV